MHFLFIHLDCFLEELIAVGDKEEEKIGPDINGMKTKYQGRWYVVIYWLTLVGQ